MKRLIAKFSPKSEFGKKFLQYTIIPFSLISLLEIYKGRAVGWGSYLIGTFFSAYTIYQMYKERSSASSKTKMILLFSISSIIFLGYLMYTIDSWK